GGRPQWRGALGAAIGLGPGAVTALLVTGATPMGNGTKIAALLAMAAGAAVAWTLGGTPVPEAPVPAATRAAPAATASAAGAQSSAPAAWSSTSTAVRPQASPRSTRPRS